MIKQTLTAILILFLILPSLYADNREDLSEKERLLQTSQDLIKELTEATNDPMKALLEFYIDYRTNQFAQANGFQNADEYRRILIKNINNREIQSVQMEINKLTGLLLSESEEITASLDGLSEKQRVINAIRQLVDELERMVYEPNVRFDQATFERKMEEISIANGFESSNALDTISRKYASDPDVLKEQKRVEELLPKLMQKAMQELGIDPNQLEYYEDSQEAESNNIESVYLSDRELKKIVSQLYDMVSGYYKVIEDNLEDPDKAVEAGNAYLKDLEPKLKALFKNHNIFVYAESQKPIMDEFQIKLETRINKAVTKIQDGLDDADALQAIQGQMQKLAQLLQSAAEPEVPASVSGEIAEKQKKAIMGMLDSIKDLPVEAREMAIENMINGYTGDKEALKKEIRERLGW